jgi:hypothetical protein
VLLTCRPAVAPQGNLGGPAFPSWTRSDELKVVGEVLADDVHTATPPRGLVESRVTSPTVEDARVETPYALLMLEGQLLLGKLEQRSPL